jgi:hypothetical protein
MPYFIRRGLFFALVLSLLSVHASACSICGCDDPLAVAGDASPMAGQIHFNLQAEYLAARSANDGDPDATDLLVQKTLRLSAVYSPSNALNLVLRVPLMSKFLAASGGSIPASDVTQNGLGDLDLGARFFIFQKMDLARQMGHDLAFSAGSTLPTGPDDAQADGDRLDQHAQLGTGAFGPYLGLLYALHSPQWGLSGNLYGRFHGVNGFDYAFGDALTGGIFGRWNPWNGAAASLGLEARYADRDQDGGVKVEDTGGTLVHLVPGLAFDPWGEVWMEARVELPIYANLFGRQEMDPIVQFELRL